MGCSHSQDHPAESQEERLITTHEADLGFYTRPASLIEAQIKREAANGSLTLAKLRRALSILGIPLPLDKPYSSCMKFLERMMETGVISTSKLAITAILLGSSTPQERAMLLFDHADVEARDSLERSAVSALFNEIVYVAAEGLPVLAYSELDETLIQNYQRRLTSNAKLLIQLGVDAMMEREHKVNQARFVARLLKQDLKHWLVPLELRRSLIKSHNDVVSSKNRAYDLPASGKALFFKKLQVTAHANPFTSPNKSPNFPQESQTQSKRAKAPLCKLSEEMKPVEPHDETIHGDDLWRAVLHKKQGPEESISYSF
jgi:hypothetical protein